jgi:hypothetical protein
MKTSHLVGTYQTDISMAVSWLKLNKAISSAGDCNKQGLVHVCPIRMTKSNKIVKDLLLSRFGHFVKLR